MQAVAAGNAQHNMKDQQSSGMFYPKTPLNQRYIDLIHEKTHSTMLPRDFKNALINTFSIYSHLFKYTYTTVQKFTASKILLMFLNFFVSYAHQSCIYMFKNTIKSEIL